jgi:hypothetical protein
MTEGNLYKIVGVNELLSKRELKVKYKTFLGSAKYDANLEKSLLYVNKKAAWTLLMDPIEKAKMDWMIEEAATPERRAARELEKRRRKTVNLCTLIAFLGAIVLPIVLEILNVESIGLVMTFALLLPMIVLYLLNPFSYLIYIGILPYVVGILAWIWFTTINVTNAFGLIILFVFWYTQYTRSKIATTVDEWTPVYIPEF